MYGRPVPWRAEMHGIYSLFGNDVDTQCTDSDGPPMQYTRRSALSSAALRSSVI